MPSVSRLERALWVAVAVLLSAQMLVVAERNARPTGSAAAPTATAPAVPGEPGTAAPLVGPDATSRPGDVSSTAPVLPSDEPGPPSSSSVATSGEEAGAQEPRATTSDATTGGSGATGTGTVSASGSTSNDRRIGPEQRRFEAAFPAHAAARQDPADPSTTRWAVLVGVNEHQGRTRDNVGSRQDAEDLAAHLLSLGWREDHVLVLADHAATREGIEQALRWLARKTDGHSVSIVHYSGHTRQWRQDIDGDGERMDEGLWPSDNRFITDRRFVELVGGVDGRLWVNIAACEAAGLGDPGLARDGRILTFSSREDQKSYEDPSVDNSVWGFFLIDEALRAGFGDADGDGDVTVQEAFEFAAPRAARRTSRQAHGPQNPVVDDRAGGGFSLRLPAPRDAQEEPSPEPRRCGLPVCLGDDGGARR